MISTIIFDMNGVIVDDEELHELAFQNICLDLGINLTNQDYKDLCIGRTDENGFEMIIKNFLIKNYNINELVTKKSNE